MEKKKKKPTARPTPLDILIGRNVKLRREMLGYSQAQLAEGMGVSEPLISLLESGKKPWNSTTLYKVCNFLRCELAELAGGVILSPEDNEDLEAIRALRENRRERESIKKDVAAAKNKLK